MTKVSKVTKVYKVSNCPCVQSVQSVRSVQSLVTPTQVDVELGCHNNLPKLVAYLSLLRWLHALRSEQNRIL
jgi:hypothetical protein